MLLYKTKTYIRVHCPKQKTKTQIEPSRTPLKIEERLKIRGLIIKLFFINFVVYLQLRDGFFLFESSSIKEVNSNDFQRCSKLLNLQFWLLTIGSCLNDLNKWFLIELMLIEFFKFINCIYQFISWNIIFVSNVGDLIKVCRLY